MILKKSILSNGYIFTHQLQEFFEILDDYEEQDNVIYNNGKDSRLMVVSNFSSKLSVLCFDLILCIF